MALALGSVVLLAGRCYAGKYNEVLSIGDRAPEWQGLPDVVSGRKHSLVDLKDVPVVVVVFTCNSCPVATDYEERILKLAGKYGAQGTKDDPAPSPQPSPGGRGGNSTAARVAVVAINVNKVKEDLPPAMKARAEKMRYPFPYLFDETQKIARDFGAIATPEFFVLALDGRDGDDTAGQASSGTRKVVYMGAMDDNSDAEAVKQKYVEAAVEAALAGKQPETTETAPSGCRIRYARAPRQPQKD
jgi:thiol-disulfide isomerase/thioredoxin